MQQKKRLVLGVIKVESFVTALEPKELLEINGGSDRWYICGYTLPQTEVQCETTEDPLTKNIADTNTCG